jgi:hypothetical protein
MELLHKKIHFRTISECHLHLEFNAGKLILYVNDDVAKTTVFSSEEDYPQVQIPNVSSSDMWDLVREGVLSISQYRREGKLLCRLNQELIEQLRPQMNSLMLE